MRSFFKQAEGTTLCGPVAIHNLLISLGKRSLNPTKIAKIMSWNARIGVTNRSVTKILRQLKLNFVHKKGIKIPYIVQQLNKGHKIIFSYQYSKASAHLVLLLSVKKKNNKIHLLAINDISDKSRFCIKQWISVDYYNGKSKKYGTYCSWRRFRMPQCWVIKS